MAGLVQAIYVFNSIKSLEALILRSRLPRIGSECFEAPKT
jgi:hypothetical protein